MIHDGPFLQVSGRLLDQSTIAALKERKASIDEVIRTLGAPQERIGSGTDSEVLVYLSVRTRTAYKTFLGIRHSESTQTMSDKWQLFIAAGRLSAFSHQGDVE
jgi:hypothetical protein